MPKIRITQDVPPMPGPEGEMIDNAPDQNGPSSPLTGSEKTDLPAVSEELAGDLIALPFDAWHLFNDAVDPLSETEKARLAGPFARILEKYGLGKVAKDEIIFGFYLTAITYGRIKAAKEASAMRKITEGKANPEPIHAD